jgi:Flp pilus assembly protein TadD
MRMIIRRPARIWILVCLIISTMCPKECLCGRFQKEDHVALLNKSIDFLSYRKFHPAQTTLQEAMRGWSYVQEVYEPVALYRALQNELPKAQETYRKAIRFNPDLARFHDNKGISYFNSGNFQAGVVEFQKALRIDPHDMVAGINLGRYFLQRREYQRAIPYFRAARVLQSLDAGALLDLTRACFGVHHLQEAREASLRLSAIAGSDAKIRFSLGLLLAQNGQFRMAVNEFSAVPPSQRDFATYMNIGMVYSKLQRLTEARNAYENALELNPSSPDPYLQIGIDYATSGEDSRAVNWISEAYAKAPDRKAIAYAFAEELIQNGNYSWAQIVLSRSMKLHRNATDLVKAQGDLDLAQQQVKQAERAYLRCLRIDPKRIDALLSLAVAYLQLSNEEDARQQLEKVLQIQPENAEANALLGRIALMTGNTKTALKLTENALRQDPNNKQANEDLAEIWMREGHFRQAYSVLEKLIRLDPQKSRLHYLLGRALLKLGRRNEAEHELELSKSLEEAAPARPNEILPEPHEH